VHYKDAVLDQLAARANVAQFVSYDPALRQRYSRLFGFEANHVFSVLGEALHTLLNGSIERSVNVRSYDPASAKSREFVYGIRSVEGAEAAVRRLAGEGLHTIVNETIDVHDGGVSGVAIGNLIEFAPDDTPRCVEKPGTASLPRDLGLRLLETVYGFRPSLEFPSTTRVEFSIHPLRRGVRGEHTIVWELEDVGEISSSKDLSWPNLFSRKIGDKAFGLLIANLIGLPVPLTLVISRDIAPFEFGKPTGAAERWIRTSPRIQVPGKFTTRRGWTDPYRLMAEEDPEGKFLASILSQQEIHATFSGAVLSDAAGALTVEGTKGFGDEFMVGRARLAKLPAAVLGDVEALYGRAADRFGPVRMEWVHDGREAWVVQFHRGASVTVGSVIYPGDFSDAVRFDVNRGLEALRDLIADPEVVEQGIILEGDVGVTSHFGDVLRKARVPSRLHVTSPE
jgi:hypothetical protein